MHADSRCYNNGNSNVTIAIKYFPVFNGHQMKEKMKASNITILLDLSTCDKGINSQFTYCNVSKKM